MGNTSATHCHGAGKVTHKQPKRAHTRKKNTHTHTLKHARVTHTRTHVHTGGTLLPAEVARVLTLVGATTLEEVLQKAQSLPVPNMKRKDNLNTAIAECNTWRRGLGRPVPQNGPVTPQPLPVPPPSPALHPPPSPPAGPPPPPTVQPPPAAPPPHTVQQPPAAPRPRNKALLREIVTTFLFCLITAFTW